MYIRGLISWNFAELTESVPIDSPVCHFSTSLTAMWLKKRARRITLVIFLLTVIFLVVCLCSVSLSHGDLASSLICDGQVLRSYSLVFVSSQFLLFLFL